MNKNRFGILDITAICAAVLILWSLVPLASASQPAGRPCMHLPNTALLEQYRGGSQNGYGVARKYSVSSTPASTSTTMVSLATQGVYCISFYNSGEADVYVALNGEPVTVDNTSVIVPAGLTFLSWTKTPTSTMSYYCPTGSSTLFVSY